MKAGSFHFSRFGPNFLKYWEQYIYSKVVKKRSLFSQFELIKLIVEQEGCLLISRERDERGGGGGDFPREWDRWPDHDGRPDRDRGAKTPAAEQVEILVLWEQQGQELGGQFTGSVRVLDGGGLLVHFQPHQERFRSSGKFSLSF